jgi:hypothetical protein
MWNPFRSKKLKPVIPSKITPTAEGGEKNDPNYIKEMQLAKIRSAKAIAEINMLHENLAANTLHNLRGSSHVTD